MRSRFFYPVWLLLAVTIIMAALSGCSSLRERMVGHNDSPDSVVTPTDQIVLLNKGQPTCQMILSDELYGYLQKNRADTLEKISAYFDVTVHEQIEENVVYLRPHGKEEVLPTDGESTSAAEESAKEPFPVSEEEKALRDLILKKAKTVIGKAASYSKKPYRELLAQRTAAEYRSAAELLAMQKITSLLYSDYCVVSDGEETAVVGGSLEGACDALEYLRANYMEGGTVRGDFYLTEKPQNTHFEAEYLHPAIDGRSVGDYLIVLQSDETYYDSADCAAYLNEYFRRNLGSRLPVSHGSEAIVRQHTIVAGRVDDDPVSAAFYEGKPDIFDYLIEQSGDDLYLLGGSDWALQYAADELIRLFFSQSKNVPDGFRSSGSIYGKSLFVKTKGADLRVMSNNVWDKPCNTTAWQMQGEDCSNYVRFRQMAKAYMAYDPDVLALQEINHYYIGSVVQAINDSGRHYQVADHYVKGRAYRNWTPILYNTETLTLLDGDSHTFRYASNKDSKSYTWAYFEEKKTGKRFVVFSTHLWWRKNTPAAPNNSLYREKQLQEVCTKANELVKEYDCPCLILGDFNCTVSAEEYGVLEKMGFADCYELATQYAKNLSGRYTCNEKSFSYRVKGDGYGKSIDHIAVRNLKKSKVLTYDYVTPNFYGKLSDHAPVYVDIRW